MKTKYRHIEFIESGELFNGKPVYDCQNIKDKAELGRVFYYPFWKRYVINFESSAVFDHTCLADIQHFLEQLK